MPPPQLYRPELDRDKLDELILYVAERALTDENFGKTKLNKILWMSEFHHYSRHGAAIVGGAYVRQTHGPVLADLDRHLRRLEDAGRLAVRVRDRYGRHQHRPIALERPDLGKFRGTEIAAVEDVIHETRGMTATQISALSHEHIGWQSAEHGERIEYATALIPLDPDDDG